MDHNYFRIIIDDINVYGYSKSHYGHEPSAGLMILREPKFVANDNDDKQQRLQLIIHQNDIVAYCVGDFNAKDSYEIVTAWVDDRYKGMQFAMKATIYDLPAN